MNKKSYLGEAIPYLRDRRSKVLILSEIHRSGWTSEKVAGYAIIVLAVRGTFMRSSASRMLASRAKGRQNVNMTMHL